MPRKPGQQTRTAVLSAFWATSSGQRERTARYALIVNAGLRGERPYRPVGGLYTSSQMYVVDIAPSLSHETPNSVTMRTCANRTISIRFTFDAR